MSGYRCSSWADPCRFQVVRAQLSLQAAPAAFRILDPAPVEGNGKQFQLSSSLGAMPSLFQERGFTQSKKRRPARSGGERKGGLD